MSIPFSSIASAVQSADGKTLTLLDQSPYGGASNEGYTTANFVRNFILMDAYGNQLANISITGTALSITWPVPSDQWVFMQLFLVGINPVPNYPSPQYGLPLDRQTKNLYRTLLVPGCCQNRSIKEKIDNANDYLFGAYIEGLSGNGAGFNNDINAANAYLSAPVF